VNGRKGLSGRDDAFFILVQYYSSITCGHFGLDAGGAHYWCKRVTMKAMRGRGDRQTGTDACRGIHRVAERGGAGVFWQHEVKKHTFHPYLGTVPFVLHLLYWWKGRSSGIFMLWLVAAEAGPIRPLIDATSAAG